VEISADLLALSAGMRLPTPKDLSGIMKLNRNPEGYFIEAHVKLRPVDMPRRGHFPVRHRPWPQTDLRKPSPRPRRLHRGP
jgi:heterodisulfide reductase subunit A-like polyferredoxin